MDIQLIKMGLFKKRLQQLNLPMAAKVVYREDIKEILWANWFELNDPCHNHIRFKVWHAKSDYFW